MSDNSTKSALETKVIETWATLDYRADKWGPERIVFDAVSNHFPEDCGGTEYAITFFQGDAHVDFRDYDPAKPVEEILFSDNGKGYGYVYTVLHYSNKKDRETQTGKFGEGLKMISAAALRHTVDIEFASQDWTVRPTIKKLFLADENRKVDFLCQEITTGAMRMKGSYTLIRKPSAEIIGHVSSFAERIIDFRDDLPLTEVREIHPKHRLFVPEKPFEGELFVKKIKYHTPKPLYLTYQLNGRQADALLSPDRDHVIETQLESILKNMILQLHSAELITPLLQDFTPDCVEKNIYFSSDEQPLHPHQWRNAFYQLYGQKAVLEAKNKPNVNADASAQGYTVVKIPFYHTLLRTAGVKTADDILNYKPKYDFVPFTNLTSDQQRIYSLHSRVNQILFVSNSPAADLHIFSRAYDDSGDQRWFKGMSHWNEKDKRPQIYIHLDQLQNQEDFLATYAHEAIHVFTQSPDMCKEFEEGLTKALGKVLSVAFKKQ